MNSHVPIILHHITLTQLAKEVLVVRDNNQLEIRMVLAFVDDAVSPFIKDLHHQSNETLLYKTSGKRVDIFRVQGVRGLVQRKDAAVLTKRVRKGQPNDDGRQHLLSC
jgi:hypothetical protein